MYREIRYDLAGLSIYRNFLKEPVVIRGLQTIDNILKYGEDSLDAFESYHEFIFMLYEKETTFKDFLLYFILHDDNPFSRAAEHKAWHKINKDLIKATARDLAVLKKIYDFPWNKIYPESVYPDFSEPRDAKYPEFFKEENWEEILPHLARYYFENSRGIASVYRALAWEKGKGLTGIKNPDRCYIDDLLGLDYQIKRLCQNTEFFLKGYPANNVLLYGPRGTGKSTMIKALLDKYRGTKLRLVEVRREDLNELPEVVDELGKYNLKFIIYIDDLSFEDYETEYKGLKAVLEGTLKGKNPNVLIYATSNRRHLVKEYFSDRAKASEEVHFFDSMEEKLSLSDRFGLIITIPQPNREIYLNIVKNLARKRGLKISDQLLETKAIEWERSHHGFSGRTARQFVDSLGEYYEK
ncbi:ATP-binding protein [Thermosyntropha sp.]|uniref:ATP-binding protein n=1 Tax=Thermosyntropha sp. TaxID=2740820 RepID=UPI0025EE87E1|nr:ATP-binding protein [Thermosyntropha sp.]MBO8158122.1 ATP-binding protein [Thermosyntropha sp.]